MSNSNKILNIKNRLASKRLRIPEKYIIYGEATIEAAKFFCRRTSVHGIHYIVDENNMNRNLSEARGPIYAKPLTKLIFISASLFLGFGCLYMMFLVYDRYTTNPTVTSIESNNYPIYLVPFPAVTLCNVNKVYKPKTEAFYSHLISTGIERPLIDNFFHKLSALINPEFIDGVFLKIYIILESLGYNSEMLMQEVSQPCENLIKMCFWLAQEVPCKQLFRRIEAQEGFCCSFNYHAIRNDLKYRKLNINETKNLDDDLLYVTGAGKSVGISVLLDPEMEHYTSVSRPYYGIEGFVHDPEEQPNVITMIAQAGIDVSVRVTPSVTVSDPTIRNLPLSQRLCFFEDEKKLRNTDTYSFQSCMDECKVDTILDLCNCIPFIYPETRQKSFSRYYRQCSLRDVNCLRNYRHIFSSLDTTLPDESDPTANATDDGMNCDCYPTCSERQYSTSLLIGDRRKSTIISSIFGDQFTENHTAVHVYFKDFTCIKYRRDVYMSWDTLFSSFGGIFGLCLGGSVLSIIEFIYIFTFKLWFMVHSERRRRLIISDVTNGTKRTIISLKQPPAYSSIQYRNKIFAHQKRNPFMFGN